MEGGSIHLSPSPNAQGNYSANVAVTITAVPSPGYEFDHWEGNLGGDANPASVVMDSNKAVTAVFVQSNARHTLTAVAGSPGGGRVILNPIQPNDGYAVNTKISLTAVADAGYVFSYWQGDLSSTTNPGSVTLDGDKTVTAIFNPTVEIGIDPPGGGVVVLEPVWLPNGYPVGMEVTVRATAAKGYQFSGWSGDLSGSANPTVMVMDSPKEITANFVEREPFPWWWIALGVVLLLPALVVVRLAYVLLTRRATEDSF